MHEIKNSEWFVVIGNDEVDRTIGMKFLLKMDACRNNTWQRYVCRHVVLSTITEKRSPPPTLPARIWLFLCFPFVLSYLLFMSLYVAVVHFFIDFIGVTLLVKLYGFQVLTALTVLLSGHSLLPNSYYWLRLRAVGGHCLVLTLS